MANRCNSSTSFHIRISRELGARGRKDNTNLRGEGILPPKRICAGFLDRLELGNNVVGVCARERTSPDAAEERGVVLHPRHHR